ncbi:MAG: NupC/NupG family nucleoside CNT transporter [Planctomycetes bacterium]|nr:NupC/NupG family nucleoside CNT transporter [Planctomycetota bacterium]
MHYDRSEWSFGNAVRGLIGVLVLVGIAVLMSEDRRRFPWRLVVAAVLMQIVLGFCLIQVDLGRGIFEWISTKVTRLLEFTNEGTNFVFGGLVIGDGNSPALAFKALPTIIFFSCLMSVLYHLRIMHYAILVLARIMNRFLGVTGAESMAMAANVFVGQTEAPLVIKKFVPTMTRSELASLMVGGFATVAGSVLASYISFLSDAGGEELVPHLLIASVMSAPAAFAISKVIVPETKVSETGAAMSTKFKSAHDNVLDAAAAGTSDGLKLWLNVFAMLLAFIAMVALINALLGSLGEPFGLDLSLERILGWVFAPIAFLMGVPWSEATTFGSLLGVKVGVNEFIGYIQLQGEVARSAAGEAGALSHRSLFMATYALCGFANFASIGIQIGGISPLAPERRGEIISLALKAMFGGALASWMTASVAGMFF